MLKFLGVSRSGYRAFLNRKVSPSKQRKEAVKKEIARLKRELRDAQDALDVLKKAIGILGKD